jgi:hypothetical protein
MYDVPDYMLDPPEDKEVDELDYESIVDVSFEVSLVDPKTEDWEINSIVIEELCEDDTIRDREYDVYVTDGGDVEYYLVNDILEKYAKENNLYKNGNPLKLKGSAKLVFDIEGIKQCVTYHGCSEEYDEEYFDEEIDSEGAESEFNLSKSTLTVESIEVLKK